MKFVGTSETKLGEKLKEERKVSGKKPKKKKSNSGKVQARHYKNHIKMEKKN